MSSASAFSYVRFSSPEQSKGDSLRRQTDAAAAWCKRHKVRLDVGLTLRDLGKSAFTGEHRKNPDRHALALFLKSVESGRVRRGDYLLIENLDRLSREEIVPAVNLLTGILLAGVRVVQLFPTELVLTDKSDMGNIMLAVVELSRGHSESAMKRTRTVANWGRKRKDAREGGSTITHWLPAWVEEKGGKRVAIPGRAAAVVRVFELSAAGYGNGTLVRKLTEEGFPALTPSGKWTTSYVNVILGDRRAPGEHQPRDKHGKPDGDPIADYYPRVVSEELWGRARAACKARHDPKAARSLRGRVGEHVHLFAGLITSARDGESYLTVTRNDEGGKRHVLVNFASTQKRAPCYAFPAATFEHAIIRQLRELDVSTILPPEAGAADVARLGGELAALDARIGQLSEALEGEEVRAVVNKIRELEARRGGLAEELTEARARSANPLSEQWGNLKALADALQDEAADPAERRDLRLKVRSALRQCIDRIYLLVIPRGRDRLAAAQVHFRGGEARRSYLILHRPARKNARGGRDALPPWSESLKGVVPDNENAFDLRAKGGVKRLEELLDLLEYARDLPPPSDE
jgi:DNA invertase Pin-like site-specific DNA recombinase